MRTASTMTACSIVTPLSRFRTNRTAGLVQPGIIRFVMARFITQPLPALHTAGRGVDTAARKIFRAALCINQRNAPPWERREARAVDQRHIGFRRKHAIMPSSRQRTTSLIIRIIIRAIISSSLKSRFRLADACQRVIHRGIFFFLRLTLAVASL